jgi:hypothetical protein
MRVNLSLIVSDQRPASPGFCRDFDYESCGAARAAAGAAVLERQEPTERIVRREAARTAAVRVWTPSLA